MDLEIIREMENIDTSSIEIIEYARNVSTSMKRP